MHKVFPCWILSFIEFVLRWLDLSPSIFNFNFDLITIIELMSQHGIYFPLYNLCNSSPSLRNWPPPLINPHRNVALDMTNLPMLVYSSLLAGLMMHFTICCERMRSLTSWFPSKHCLARNIISTTCACFSTHIFYVLHASPQLLHSLFNASWPFQNIDFEVTSTSDATAWWLSLTVERSHRFYMVSKFPSAISS